MKQRIPLIVILFVLVLSVMNGERALAASSQLPPLAEGEMCTLSTGVERQVYRVYYEKPEDIRLLVSFDLFEFNNRLEQYVLVAASPTELLQIRSLGFRTVLDLEETANFKKLDMLRQYSLNTLPPPYNCYRTVEEIFAYANAIATTYPDLAEWIDVGDSWEKSVGQPDGYDMMILRLTNETIPGDKPKLFITAAIHAREYTTAELAARFSGYLIENYNNNADIHWLLDYHEIHIMLQANPDGRKEAEIGLSWRKNTNENYCGVTSTNRGADLNRNFDFLWNGCPSYYGCSSGNPCDTTYRGPVAASEPETQAVQNYMNLIFPDQRDESSLSNPAPDDATGVYIDLHSYSRLVLWSWGFSYDPAPNATGLQTLGRRFAFFNNHVPQQSSDLYPTDGSTDDYAYGRLGVAGYCFELGDEFFEECSVFENDILPNNLPALLYASKVSRTPYITPAGPNTINLALDDSTVPAGTPVTLTAQVNDTQFRSGYSDPTQPIAQTEYAIDIPYWEDGYSPIAMNPSDGSFNSTIENVTATIDTTSLNPGRHIIYVRGKDTGNNWGAVSAIFLTIEGDLNNPPVANDIEVWTRYEAPISITLTGSDPDADPITFAVVDEPLHGSLSGTSPDLTYTPNQGFVGTDTFTYKANDGQLLSELATVTIHVDFILFLPVIMN